MTHDHIGYQEDKVKGERNRLIIQVGQDIRDKVVRGEICLACGGDKTPTEYYCRTCLSEPKELSNN